MRLIENARSWLTAGAAMMALAGAASAEPASAPKTGGHLTEADVTASNEKLADAYPALVQMWTDQLAGIGRRFVAPRLARYRGGARTACGLMGSGNGGTVPTPTPFTTTRCSSRAKRRLPAHDEHLVVVNGVGVGTV